MQIKDLNLYINEKNIVTIQPFATNTSYGLIINGIEFKFGELYKPDKALVSASLSKMKALQTNIIKKIEK